ncbi:MAG: hypothetical protein JEZ11_09375 [Desulfobacterales bacterium]|nr:hypothetical protein [Desulfobacterales bacterium]
MRSRRCAIGVLALLAALSLPWGCSVTTAVLPQTSIEVSRVLVLPFVNVAAIYGDATHASCPVTGKVFLTGPVSDQAAALMTDALAADLGNRRGVDIFLPGQGVGVMSEILRSGGDGISERELWVEAGRALQADAVLVGHIYRFKPRHGSDYSAESPASVAFDLHLLAATDGRVLWSRSVDETQQSLSENLLSLGAFFQRRGRWVTADELAMVGLGRILSALPVGKHLDK